MSPKVTILTRQNRPKMEAFLTPAHFPNLTHPNHPLKPNLWFNDLRAWRKIFLTNLVSSRQSISSRTFHGAKNAFLRFLYRKA